jgi:hypothetical protein
MYIGTKYNENTIVFPRIQKKPVFTVIIIKFPIHFLSFSIYKQIESMCGIQMISAVTTARLIHNTYTERY